MKKAAKKAQPKKKAPVKKTDGIQVKTWSFVFKDPTPEESAAQKLKNDQKKKLKMNQLLFWLKGYKMAAGHTCSFDAETIDSLDSLIEKMP